jgi:hypothetical protein
MDEDRLRLLAIDRQVDEGVGTGVTAQRRFADGTPWP